MKRKMVLPGMAAGMLLVVVGFTSRYPVKTSFETARETIVMRQVSHKILQYSGDSSTPVLPVKRLSENEFQIPFKTSFSFKPDSLVTIIGATLQENHLPADYIVQVSEPVNHTVVFGYAVLGSQQQNIVPCNGRDQPAKPYTILISFKENTSKPGNWLIGAGIALLLLGTATSWRKKTPAEPVIRANEAIIPGEKSVYNIGTYLFYPANETLVHGNQTVILTSKEAKLLRIFSGAPNQLVDRTRLQKEVWEDEGVIVGRSLDVFVSKLRKKLEADPAIKIVSVHGRGYKMEVDEGKI